MRGAGDQLGAATDPDRYGKVFTSRFNFPPVGVVSGTIRPEQGTITDRSSEGHRPPRFAGLEDCPRG